MHRFSVNRWWTLIVTLALCIACSARPRIVLAGGSDPSQFGDPSGTNGGMGDPDVPDSPGKQGLPRGQMRPVTHVNSFWWHSAGDGVSQRSVLMWRLRVLRWSLQTFFVRF